MNALDVDIARGIANANRAKELSEEAYNAFTRACEAYDWVAAEAARTEMLAHAESFVDQIAAAYKRLEVARP